MDEKGRVCQMCDGSGVSGWVDGLTTVCSTCGGSGVNPLPGALPGDPVISLLDKYVKELDYDMDDCNMDEDFGGWANTAKYRGKVLREARQKAITLREDIRRVL